MNRISKEYAAALFSLAAEKGQEALFGSALRDILKAFETHPEYRELLNTPSIPAAERRALAAEAFGDTVPQEVLSMLQILSTKGYIPEFGPIAAEYEKLLDHMNSVSAAQVRSACPLSDEEKDKLKKKLEKISGRSVIMTCTSDPSLLGGVVVEMDGKLIDGSLRTRLRRIKEVIGG